MLLALAITPSVHAGIAPGPITLAVDATEATKKIFHVKMSFPVTPGPLSLSYPKWIPGEHGPTGPLTDVAGLHVTAGGKSLPWERDPIDMYAIRVTVPAGVRSIDVVLDFRTPRLVLSVPGEGLPVPWPA